MEPTLEERLLGVTILLKIFLRIAATERPGAISAIRDGIDPAQLEPPQNAEQESYRRSVEYALALLPELTVQ